MSILIRLIAPSLLSLAMVGTAAAQSSTTTPQGTGTQPQASGQATGQATGQAATAAPAGDILTEQEDGQTLSSQVIGAPLVNEEGNELGEITDLIMNDQQQVIGAVVSVGGFLGLGSKSVGLPWQALRIEEREGTPVAVVGMTEQQLSEAPEFKTMAQIEAEQAAQQQAPTGGTTQSQ